MRKAGAIGARMIGGIMERVEPDLAKNEHVAEVYRDTVRGVDGAWGDYPVIVPPPALTRTRFGTDGQPFRSGEATFFEISGCHRRYHAPLSRTVLLGTPPRDMHEAEAALVEGIAAGLDAARPGAMACDIADAVMGVLRKAGIERSGRMGYAVGLSYPPDWSEHTVSIRESDRTELKPGMTFHLMPALWMQQWGLEITETIVIGESGPAECLGHYPRKIVVKP